MRADSEWTEYQIRVVIHDRLKKSRTAHLQKFRQNGRLIILASDTDPLQAVLPTAADWTPDSALGRPSRKRFSANGLLRAIELIALFSLIAVLGYGGRSLLSLNAKSRTDWGAFPVTPTPLIRALVLPDGHTPPTSPEGARPRDEEIPAHLRPQVEAYYNLPTPTAAPHQGIRIQIPALAIDAPIIQGDGWEQLKKGVAQHLNTANPGEKGNMVLSGHNDIYGEVFRYLDRLKAGDQIIIFTHRRSYTYVVDGWVLVKPNQVEVMDPTPDETLTLISCYPYLIDSDRIIVKARLSKG